MDDIISNEGRNTQADIFAAGNIIYHRVNEKRPTWWVVGVGRRFESRAADIRGTRQPTQNSERRITFRSYRTQTNNNEHESLFGFLRHLTTGHCPHLLLSAGLAAIDRYRLVAGPTAANPLDSFTDPAPHTMPTLSINILSFMT